MLGREDCLVLNGHVAALPARSGGGGHLVPRRLEDHAKLPLETGQRVPSGDGEGEALQDPRQEEEELHLSQGLAQTHPDPHSKWQVAAGRDPHSGAFTVQEASCRGTNRVTTTQAGGSNTEKN